MQIPKRTSEELQAELEQEIINFFQNLYNIKWTKSFTNHIINDLRNNLKNYLETNSLKCFILPLSGGLDSAIVAGLCQDLPIKTVFIDIESSNEHKKQAEKIANLYNTEHNVIIVNNKKLNDFMEIQETMTNANIRQGNIKARIRMMVAYDMANLYSGCVLSTDNYSEYNMGFWTLHGDVGDISPIQFLNKGFELQFIAEALRLPNSIISQPPSDGLNVTKKNTDEAQLGANYKLIDAIMMLQDIKKVGSLSNVLNNEANSNQFLTVIRNTYHDLAERFKETGIYKRITTLHKLTHFKRNCHYNNNIFGVKK